jgi:hypothetical protein
MPFVKQIRCHKTKFYGTNFALYSLTSKLNLKHKQEYLISERNDFMSQPQQETQQESLLTLSSVLATEFNSLNNSTPIPQTNSYKPTLVKQINKEEPTMQTKQNQDFTDIRNNNTNNSLQSFSNRPNRNTANTSNVNNSSNSSNTNNFTNSSNNSANSSSVFNLERSIDIVSSSYARIEDVYLKVQRDFVYKPNISLVVNAMVETGRFNVKNIADNICVVFGEKEGGTTRRSPIHLSDSNLEKCRQIQSQVKEILELDIDLHPVLNSMIYTGGFTPIDVAKAVRKIFVEKRKLAIQNSKAIN